MTTEIVRTNATEITNADLKKATNRIYKLSDGIKKNFFEIAYICAEVKERKLYADNYESVTDWAADCFGYKKSQTYNLCKIGAEYTEAIKDANGKITDYRSNLTEDGDDYTTTQIIPLLPVGHDVAEELNESGAINPEMSVSEIKKAVKAYQTENEEATEEATEETANEEATEEATEEVYEETIMVARTTLEMLYKAIKNGDNKIAMSTIKDLLGYPEGIENDDVYRNLD